MYQNSNINRNGWCYGYTIVWEGSNFSPSTPTTLENENLPSDNTANRLDANVYFYDIEMPARVVLDSGATRAYIDRITIDELANKDQRIQWGPPPVLDPPNVAWRKYNNWLPNNRQKLVRDQAALTARMLNLRGGYHQPLTVALFDQNNMNARPLVHNVLAYITTGDQLVVMDPNDSAHQFRVATLNNWQLTYSISNGAQLVRQSWNNVFFTREYADRLGPRPGPDPAGDECAGPLTWEDEDFPDEAWFGGDMPDIPFEPDALIPCSGRSDLRIRDQSEPPERYIEQSSPLEYAARIQFAAGSTSRTCSTQYSSTCSISYFLEDPATLTEETLPLDSPEMFPYRFVRWDTDPAELARDPLSQCPCQDSGAPQCDFPTPPHNVLSCVAVVETAPVDGFLISPTSASLVGTPPGDSQLFEATTHFADGTSYGSIASFEFLDPVDGVMSLDPIYPNHALVTCFADYGVVVTARLRATSGLDVSRFADATVTCTGPDITLVVDPHEMALRTGDTQPATAITMPPNTPVVWGWVRTSPYISMVPNGHVADISCDAPDNTSDDAVLAATSALDPRATDSVHITCTGRAEY